MNFFLKNLYKNYHNKFNFKYLKINFIFFYNMTQKNKNEDRIFKPLTILTNKEKYYYIMLMEFYKKCNPEDIQQMLDIINGKSIMSLRIIDWFVTRCSFKYKICIDNGNELFNIYISYKAQLKSYKKKYFDPFRRNSKFYFHYDLNDDAKYIYTTFGQLNFFKWAISNNVLHFIKNNFNFIICTMSSNKNSKIRKKNNLSNEFCKNKKNILQKNTYDCIQPIMDIKIKNINNIIHSPQMNENFMISQTNNEFISSQMINFICDEKLQNDIIKMYQKIKDDYLYSNVIYSHLISYTNHKQIINFENDRDCNTSLNTNTNTNILTCMHLCEFENDDFQPLIHSSQKNIKNIKNTHNFLKNNIIFETNSKILNRPIVLFFD